MTLTEYYNYVDSLFQQGVPGNVDVPKIKAAIKESARQLREDTASITAWSPVLARVANGSAVAMRVVDWINGQGAKPAVGMYLSATGYVTDIAQAGDFRGPVGPAGTVSSNSGMTVSGDLAVTGRSQLASPVGINRPGATRPMEVGANNPAEGVLAELINLTSANAGGLGALQRLSQSDAGFWDYGVLPGNIWVIRGWNGSAIVDRFRIDMNGLVGVGVATPTARLHVNGANGHSQFRLEQKYTPTGTGDANGAAGNLAWDDNYLYMKTAAGWKRAALSTF